MVRKSINIEYLKIDYGISIGSCLDTRSSNAASRRRHNRESRHRIVQVPTVQLVRVGRTRAKPRYSKSRHSRVQRIQAFAGRRVIKGRLWIVDSLADTVHWLLASETCSTLCIAHTHAHARTHTHICLYTHAYTHLPTYTRPRELICQQTRPYLDRRLLVTD